MQTRTFTTGRIRQAVYDPATQQLDLHWDSKTIQAYKHVPAEVYRRLCSAPNPTTYWEDRIAEEYPKGTPMKQPGGDGGGGKTLSDLLGGLGDAGNSLQQPPPQPFVRQAGAGPTVVCLHANASSSTQWRGLMDLLSPAWTVVAPDSYGCGKSPEWPSAHTITLDDEVRLVQHLVQGAPDRPVLVGHSYGGAVALMAAVRHPHKVRALVLYEPTLFALEEAAVPAPNGVDGIRHAVARAAQALDAGDADAAAGHFIDFWTGPGSWAATPAERKPGIAKSVVNVRRWGHALMTEPTPLAAFAALTLPVLYLTGGQSPESAHAVARRLVPVLPQVTVQRLDGLGHMGPLTHPDTVNAAIAAFLQGV